MSEAGGHPNRKGSFSMSLRKIIEEVEARSGRKFIGPELYAKPGELRGGQEAGVSRSHHRPRHPRSTSQMSLDLVGARPGAVAEAGCGAEGEAVGLPGIPLLDAGCETGGRARKPRGGVRHAEEGPVPSLTSRAAPLSLPNQDGAVIPMLPRIQSLGDEAFLLLYLSASLEFERRFGAPEWCERVLAMAARGR